MYKCVFCGKEGGESLFLLVDVNEEGDVLIDFRCPDCGCGVDPFPSSPTIIELWRQRGGRENSAQLNMFDNPS